MTYYLNPNPQQKGGRVSGPYSHSLVESMLENRTITDTALARLENSNDWIPVQEALQRQPRPLQADDFAPLIETLFDHPEFLAPLFDLAGQSEQHRHAGLFHLAHRMGKMGLPLPPVFPQLLDSLVLEALVRELKRVNWKSVL
jgi:hypothetical protein